MKSLYNIMRKNIFIYLSIISLLTACESSDKASFTSGTAEASSINHSISQGVSDSGSYTSTDGGSEAGTSISHDTFSEIASSDEPSQIPNSEDAGSASAISELQVHFIDVGQGDSTLVICGSDAMLIDAGDNNKGTTVQLYLQNQSIENLTYLIGTHPDSDHIGGLDVIMTKFDCDTVIMPDAASDTATYRDVIDAMDYRYYKNTLPHVGDIYSLGDAQFIIIAPNGEYTDDNNASVGIKLVHGNNVFLFTGDAETEAEADILQNGIDLKADVLHAGHHGSSTSCSQDFIREVSPAYAVISCGKENPYGHPHEQTLAVLKEHGVQIFRTDEQGSIVAVSDGTSITWNVEPSQNWNAGTKPELPPSENTVSNESQIKTPSSGYAAAPILPEIPSSGTPAGSVFRPESEETVPATNTITYVLNRNTGKFHYPYCRSVETIKDSNREDTTMSREEVIAEGYVPCKNCNP